MARGPGSSNPNVKVKSLIITRANRHHHDTPGTTRAQKQQITRTQSWNLWRVRRAFRNCFVLRDCGLHVYYVLENNAGLARGLGTRSSVATGTLKDRVHLIRQGKNETERL